MTTPKFQVRPTTTDLPDNKMMMLHKHNTYKQQTGRVPGLRHTHHPLLFDVQQLASIGQLPKTLVYENTSILILQIDH